MGQAITTKELRILMLEDTPTDAELMEHELRKAGFAFVAERVESRDAFVKALEEFHPDIILSDYKLPDFDGMAALQMVRHDHPDVPVIMVTGALPDVEAVELIHAGAKDYVLKDRLARLAPAVQRVLSAEQGVRARKAAEQALRESEASIKALVEHSPIAMLVDIGLEAGEKIIMMNQKFTELFGYTMDDVPDVRHWWLLAYPDEKYREEFRAEWMRRVEKAIQSHGEIEPMEATVTCKKGLKRYVRISLASIGNRNIVAFEDLTERKQAETALRESYRQVELARDEWNNAFDAVRDPLFFHDREGRITRCNRAYMEQVKLTFKEIIGRFYWEVFPINSGPFASCRHEMEKTSPAMAEEITLDSGKTFISRNFAANGPDGNYLFSVHIMEDVTERKLSAELIQRNNQLLETAFSSIHVMIAYLDKDFNFIKVNKAYAAADQRTPDFFPGKNHFDLFPSEENKAIFQQVVETGKPAIYYAKPFEYAEHPERGVSYWDWRAEPIKGIDGKVEGLLFSLLNVTEQTLAVQKIQAASQYARSLIEASLDPLVTINAEGKITDVNVATEKATGRSRAELIGTDFSDYFTEPDSARAGYQQAFSQGYVTDYPLAIRHLDGRIMDVLYNASVYRNEAGGVLGIFAAARDITERKLAEEKIKESEKKFKAMTDTSPLAIYMSSGIEQTAEYINPTFTRLFGYTLEEVPSVADWWPRAYPDEQYRKQVSEEWQRKVEQAIKTNSEIEPMEVVVNCKDGSKKDISWGYISTGVQNWAFGLDLTERKRAEVALHRLNRTLRALSASNHALVHGENERALLESMCRAATEGGFMMAWVGYAMQDEKKSVIPMATSGQGAGYVESLNITWDDQPLGRGPTGTAIRTGQTQIANDIGSNPHMAPWREAAAKYGFASSIALPLRKSGIIIGALTIYAAERGAFDAEQVALLEEMAEDLGFGLTALLTRDQRDRALEERQHYAEQLRTSLEDALQAIAATVEMRDPYTAGHQRRVAHLASAIAHEMGLSEEQCHGIHLAGIVHDLGKIHIPAEVLSKPGRLNDLEFSFIKTHPQSGYDILKGIEFPWSIAQAVLQHHERLDGSGYPQGLKNDAIILEARILAVADVVEAMASHRPYRPSLGLEAALSEIKAKRGTHFDSAVVDACMRLFESNYTLPT